MLFRSQHRSTQRRVPTGPDDEERLTADIVESARRHGRLGYRKIAEMLRSTAGWIVNDKRVERIWRREGLKVPAKQSKQGRIWFADGSCIRLRAERPNHVWSYDFVEDRTHEGRKYRMLNLIDEFTHECLAIRVDRKLKSADVIDVLSDQFILRGVPEHIRSDNGPEFLAKAVQDWIGAVGAKTAYIERAVPGRMASSRASTPGFATNCSMERSSTRLPSSSRAGGVITTPTGRTDHWATNRPRPGSSSPPSPRGPVRDPDQRRCPR